MSGLQATIGAEQGWDEWLGSLARPGGRSLEQVNVQLGKVLGWSPTRDGGPGTHRHGGGGGAAPPQRDVDVAADRAGAQPRPGAEIPLLELATQLIEEGDGGERALLERVELLRLQIANPGEDIADLSVETPPRRVVDLVRELAVDEAADGAARRQAWRALLEPIDRWVAGAGEPSPPPGRR
ncbi:hypothetical protein G7085_16955 [Tessaracoccus sp. HDW20]|uniref:hypothetical protein n=1 Tax=Tessaracoccus coleopterorum TaxID=2714950 RepID=UPI0018D3B69F|nr:hypothetical protein [Tessaracoccus coleopterorum]NHB85710.1 hypothetical protein [Tessaracoccus coleopterorum]